MAYDFSRQVPYAILSSKALEHNGCKGRYLEETDMAKPIPTYIIKAALKDFRSPATWRRFKIKKNLPITELAYYLEIMFEMYAEHQYDFTCQSDDGLVVMVNNPEEYSMVPSFPGGPKIKYVGVNHHRLKSMACGQTPQY